MPLRKSKILHGVRSLTTCDYFFRLLNRIGVGPIQFFNLFFLFVYFCFFYNYVTEAKISCHRMHKIQIIDRNLILFFPLGFQHHSFDILITTIENTMLHAKIMWYVSTHALCMSLYLFFCTQRIFIIQSGKLPTNLIHR